MTDIYSAPNSELTSTESIGGYGSIEKGIAGDYEFSVRALLSEAWSKVSGAKGAFWLAMLLYMIVAMGVSFGVGFVFSILGLSTGMGVASTGIAIGAALLQQAVIMAITTPMMVALFLMGLRRSVDSPIKGMMVLGNFDKILPYLLTIVLMYLMILVGFLLLIIPGIYLSIAYSHSLILVADKNLGPWQAMETSRKAVTKRWWRFLGLYLLSSLIIALSMIPLGIGLIWTLPWMMILYGMAYRNVFGCESHTLSE